MARTYRLRHHPSFPGTAKKFAFTHAGSWRRREQIILATARRMFPDVFINVYGGRFLKGRIAYQQCGDARSILDTLERQIVVPLMSPHSHPWRRHYGINLRVAKWYRQQAHRNMKHRTHQLLNKSPGDYEDMLMPLWYEHWDRWDID